MGRSYTVQFVYSICTLWNWKFRISFKRRRRSVIDVRIFDAESKIKCPNLGRSTLRTSWDWGFPSKYIIPFTVENLTSVQESQVIWSKILVIVFVMVSEGITSQNKWRIRQQPSTATTLTSGHSSINSFSKRKNCFSSSVSLSSFVESGSSRGNMSRSKCNAFWRTFEFATCQKLKLQILSKKEEIWYSEVCSMLFFYALLGNRAAECNVSRK